MLAIFHAIPGNVLLNFIIFYYSILYGKQMEFTHYSKTNELHLGSPVRTAPREANQLINNWLAFFIKTSFQLKTPS